MKLGLLTLILTLSFSLASAAITFDDEPFLKGVKSYYLDIKSSGQCAPSRESIQNKILPFINSTALVPNNKNPHILLRLEVVGQPQPKSKRCFGVMRIDAKVIYWNQPIPFNDLKLLASQTLYSYEHIFANMKNKEILDVAQIVINKFIKKYSQDNS